LNISVNAVGVAKVSPGLPTLETLLNAPVWIEDIFVSIVEGIDIPRIEPPNDVILPKPLICPWPAGMLIAPLERVTDDVSIAFPEIELFVVPSTFITFATRIVETWTFSYGSGGSLFPRSPCNTPGLL
jgi:hypothetical protein